MASVTQRIKQIQQPREGYINPSLFNVIQLDSINSLYPYENIPPYIVGLAVDYLTRYIITGDIQSFSISHTGAYVASRYLEDDSILNIFFNMVDGIKDIDDNSIINVCKIATFDGWMRNFPAARKQGLIYNTINPDEDTIYNIKEMVNRSIEFFKKYGPIVKEGFTFENDGYTNIVNCGDGDFLTKYTLWDFKVSKYGLNKDQTLQLAMYYIMGKHSKQDIYKNIQNVGIFNPRLNTVSILDMSMINILTIEAIEDDVICY